MLTYLGVAGWPVAHSRSPAMHNAALAAVGRHDWRYLKLPLPPDRFAETVRALPAAGFRGINVTIPHKEAALALADEATQTAAAVSVASSASASAASLWGIVTLSPRKPAAGSARTVSAKRAGGSGSLT